MTRGSRATRAAGVLALLLAHGAGCSTGDPARPDADVQLTGVGPSPLRRLSNDEYTNALRDLFPEQQLALPALPRDTTVAGFENAAEAQEPSDVRTARFHDIADRYATALTSDAGAVQRLVGCAPASEPCARRFIERTGTRIFRRPITGPEQERYLASFRSWEAAVDFDGAVRLTLTAMLQSPQFLYRVELVPPGSRIGATIPVDGYAMASRLSFFLWQSVPDDALMEAAARDELRTPEQLGERARRMLDDPRARRVLWSFHRQWLGLDRILSEEHAVRTPQIDPAWSAASQQAASLETELFVTQVLGEGGTFEDLLMSRRVWANGEVARLYGLPAPADADAWTETLLPAGERAGVLTRTSFLAAYSHRGGTSPPVRANAIQSRLLCRMPRTPPPDADVSQPKPKPGDGPQTNRMLFEARTDPSACRSCHTELNGIGFGLEDFNAAGRYQTTENGLAIDATGLLLATDVDGPFVGGVGLSAALARSEDVKLCATQQWIRYALGRAAVSAELPEVEALAQRFSASGGDVRALLVAIASSPSFRLQLVTETRP